VRLDRLVTLNLMQPLRQVIGSLSSTASPLKGWSVPILMYHNICDEPEPGISPYYQTNTSPAVFQQQMRFPANNGYRTLSINELVGLIQAPTPPMPVSDLDRCVTITFDDAFRSVYTEAFPVLQRHSFTGAVFLPTAFIGDSRQRFRPAARGGRLSSSPECMTWSEVVELRRHGWDIGSHTVNHPKLVELTWPDIRSETADSKAAIEGRLGEAITSFCYPFAFPQADRAFREGFQQLLVNAGYTSCFTTQVGCVRPLDDPFSIKRLPANSLDDAQLLEAKLVGAYDWIGWPQRIVKRAKSVVHRKRAAR
jgi:peptidoglycan/xylan/chitin deacetylase (PgdA/CDA1 family)